MLLLDLAYALLLLLTFPLWARYLFRARYRRLLGMRLRPRLEPLPGPAIWLHAVSVGEVRSLESLLHMLAVGHGQHVVLSVTTPAGLEYARDHLPGVRVIAAPFDFSFTIRRFLDAVRPKLMVFNELELWPNWSHLLHRRGVPTLLVNGRVRASSLRVYRLAAPWLKRFFNGFAAILVQTDVYRDRFLSLGVDPARVAVCGNVKADEAVAARGRLPDATEIRGRLGLEGEPRPLLTLASSHEEDEALLFPVIPRLARRFLVLVVPRHPERLPAIERRLRRAGVRYAVASRCPDVPGGLDALVYDRVGYLLPILSVSAAVVMGGTWARRIGGHNLYEPAVFGRPIFGGPHTESFPDIALALRQAGVYRQADSGAGLASLLESLAGGDTAALARAAMEAVEGRRGALQCVWNHLRPFIPC